MRRAPRSRADPPRKTPPDPARAEGRPIPPGGPPVGPPVVPPVVPPAVAPAPVIAAVASVPAAWAPPWREVRLRRDGMRPLRFAGSLIARHDGQAPGLALWHDLALYRVAPNGAREDVPPNGAPEGVAPGLVQGGYAVAIVAQRAAADGRARPARCHAALCATLDAALTRLERHDASGDVCPGLSAPALTLDDPSLSASALVLRAALLHAISTEALRRYRIGVGAFLADLGLRDL